MTIQNCIPIVDPMASAYVSAHKIHLISFFPTRSPISYRNQLWLYGSRSRSKRPAEAPHACASHCPRAVVRLKSKIVLLQVDLIAIWWIPKIPIRSDCFRWPQLAPNGRYRQNGQNSCTEPFSNVVTSYFSLECFIKLFPFNALNWHTLFSMKYCFGLFTVVRLVVHSTIQRQLTELQIFVILWKWGDRFVRRYAHIGIGTHTNVSAHA